MTRKASSDPREPSSVRHTPSPELLRDLFDTMALGVIYHDAGGHITSANPAAERMLGLKLDQIRGRTPADPRWQSLREDGTEMLPDEHAPIVALRTGSVVRNLVTGIFDPLVQATRWLSVSSFPELDIDSKPVRVCSMFEDITERKVAEKAAQENLARLVESEQRLTMALESGRLGSYELDLIADEFLSLSPTFKTLFGVGRDGQLSRAESFRAVHPDDRAQLQMALVERCTTGLTASVEFRVNWPDGSVHWLSSHGTAVFENGVPVRMIGATRDVTQQREAETALREAAELRKNVLRDVLSSVTGGKLRLVEMESEIPIPLVQTGEPIALTSTEGLGELRGRVKEAGQSLGFSEARWQGLTIAASETGMNAIVHGGGHGIAQVSTDRRDLVQVRVRDRGQGIASENLPNATLSRGWSSTTSLGYGLYLALETIDRLYLQTGPSGTTVVMEQGREEPLPAWA